MTSDDNVISTEVVGNNKLVKTSDADDAFSLYNNNVIAAIYNKPFYDHSVEPEVFAGYIIESSSPEDLNKFMEKIHAAYDDLLATIVRDAE